MSRRAFPGLAAAALVLGLSGIASAHPVPFSYLDVRVQTDRVEGSLVAHVIDLAHDLGIEPPERLLTGLEADAARPRIESILSSRLAFVVNGRETPVRWTGVVILADRQSLRMAFEMPLETPAGVLGIRCALFPYDPAHQTFLNIYEGGRIVYQGIFDRSRDRFDYYPGTPHGARAVVQRFVPAGIHHIMIGPDHILFLIGLLLLGGTLRQLLFIVTAFTLAHSVTLSLAALAIVSPPTRLIEPAIALSIVYVGADNLLVKGGRDMRPWIALSFGFIHGFGFASVLREMDLPTRALGWSLFSFNAGVEIGQIVIVTAVASVLGALRSRNAVLGQRIAFAGSILVICAGTFWFVQRVFFVTS
jgi:hydrogenase/urease accessory protein HupE